MHWGVEMARKGGVPPDRVLNAMPLANDGIEVLLFHLGGPFWRNKEIGSWSIPKGLITERETPLAAEKREFAEETGHRPRGKARSLGEAKQPGGKIVYVWAIEGDWDADTLKSNMFEMEWPPKSGKRQKFPELDRAGWFKINEAVFLDHLLRVVAQE